MTFQDYGLLPALVQATADLGFTTPTPVQQQCLQRSVADPNGDLMVCSQTGSGKTAAFLLPVLQRLLAAMPAAADSQDAPAPAPAKGRSSTGRAGPRTRFAPQSPRALVLCPTRELAQQVAQDAIDLVRHARGMRIAHVVGGVSYDQQIARLQGAQVVVATPGRLLDLLRGSYIDLQKVEVMVVDEADRMLDLGFAEDLEAIAEATAARAQTLMFSATFAPRIQALASHLMRNPQKVEVNSGEQHADITQTLYWADSAGHKKKLLDHWLRDTTIEQAIVFASTQVECDSLAVELQELGFSAVALHGALSQTLRNRRLNMLREGRIQFLVATDVAARGIDVPSISHVFNYGLPLKPEDYTHRIGRTGRAGRQGFAITLAERREARRIGAIEHYIRRSLPVQSIAGLEPQPRSSTRFAPRGAGPAGRSFEDRRPPGKSAGPRRPDTFAKEGWGRERPPQEDRGYGGRGGAGGPTGGPSAAAKSGRPARAFATQSAGGEGWAAAKPSRTPRAAPAGAGRLGPSSAGPRGRSAGAGPRAAAGKRGRAYQS